MKTIDLHIHTTASDGTFTPRELVDYAVEKKLSAVAITDHDTMRGIKEALNHIKELQLPLELIPGMEVSTSSSGFYYELHILAYFMDKNEKEVTHIINNVEVELDKSTGDVQDVLKIITKYGGISVLAHPQEYFLSISELDKLIGKLASIGLNGIEAIYTTHNDREIEQFKKIASKYDLLYTGGSDFHGARKPGVDLGSGFGEMEIPYDIVDSLKKANVEAV